MSFPVLRCLGIFLTLALVCSVASATSMPSPHVSSLSATERVSLPAPSVPSPLAASIPITATAQLVRDLYPVDHTPEAWPDSFVTMGAMTYFTVWSYASGREVWRSDGTAAGTTLLYDFRPGQESAFIQPSLAPDYNGGALYNAPIPGLLTVISNTLFIAVPQGRTGQELWKSDGTPEGTTLITSFGTQVIKRMLTAQGLLFFQLDDHFWRSDGTTSGTTEVSPVALTLWTVMSDTLYLSGSPYELWKSDGTNAGTVPVADVASDPSTRVWSMVAESGHIFFSILFSPVETWVSDGTAAGTIRLNGRYSTFTGTAQVDNLTYYISQKQLWQTDGTPTGTKTVTDTAVSGIAVYHNSLFVVGLQGLMRRDGPNQPLVLVKAGAGGPGPQDDPSLSEFEIVDDILYIVTTGSFIRTDGTEAGTWAVDSYPSLRAGAVNNKLVFNFAGELGTTDGTEAGTRMLLELGQKPGSSDPRHFAALGAKTLFFTNDTDTTYRPELWATDGIAEHTIFLTDTQLTSPQPYSHEYAKSIVYKNALYFTSANYNQGLSKTDGTREGTVVVSSEVYDKKPLVMNNVLYVVQNDVFHDDGYLWRTDGSDGGLQQAATFPGGGDYTSR